MTVTALECDSRGAGGVRVQVDGGPFATVSARDVAELGLRVGLALGAAAAAALEARAESYAARSAALRMLATRALPGREIERRLVRKGCARATARGVLEQLVDEGLVNDAEYARHFVRTRAARRRLGPARLTAELRRLGVDDEVAEEAVRETLSREAIDPATLLAEAAARKARELEGLDVPTRRRRLRIFLLRRGFAPAEVTRTVAALVGR